MFALPLLAGDSTVDITGALESASYLGMTVKALADFGVRFRSHRSNGARLLEIEYSFSAGDESAVGDG